MDVKFTCINKMRHCPTKIKDKTSCVPALAKMTYLVHADASLYPDGASKLCPGKYLQVSLSAGPARSNQLSPFSFLMFYKSLIQVVGGRFFFSKRAHATDV